MTSLTIPPPTAVMKEMASMPVRFRLASRAIIAPLILKDISPIESLSSRLVHPYDISARGIVKGKKSCVRKAKKNCVRKSKKRCTRKGNKSCVRKARKRCSRKAKKSCSNKGKK